MSTDYKEKLGDYPVHPDAAAYPMMDDGRLQDLAEDIAENGQREPIILAYEELGQKGRRIIIDGRNRFAACELAGVEPEFVTKPDIEPDEIGSWIEAHNRFRRHLTPDEYRQLSVAERREVMAASLKAEPEKSNRQHAQKLGASPTTAGKVRKELEESGELSKVDSRKSADGKTRPAAAKQKRRPLTDVFPGVVEKLRKASVTLTTVSQDDRVPRNREALSRYLPDIERIQGVIDTARLAVAGSDDVPAELVNEFREIAGRDQDDAWKLNQAVSNYELGKRVVTGKHQRHEEIVAALPEGSLNAYRRFRDDIDLLATYNVEGLPFARQYELAVEQMVAAVRRVESLQSRNEFAELKPHVGIGPGQAVSRVQASLSKIRQGLNTRKQKGKK